MKNFLRIKNKGGLIFFLFVLFSFYLGHQFAKEGIISSDDSVLSQAQEQFLNISDIVEEIQFDTSFLDTIQSEGGQFYRPPRILDPRVRTYTIRSDPFDLNAKPKVTKKAIKDEQTESSDFLTLSEIGESATPEETPEKETPEETPKEETPEKETPEETPKEEAPEEVPEETPKEETPEENEQPEPSDES